MTHHPSEPGRTCRAKDAYTPRSTWLAGRLAYRAVALAAAVGLGGCDDDTRIGSMAGDSASTDPIRDASLDLSSSGTGSDAGTAFDGGHEASSPADAGAASDHLTGDAPAPGETSTGMPDGDSAPFDAVVPSDSGPPFDNTSSDGGTSGGDVTSLDGGTSGGDATSLDSMSSDGAAPTAGVRLLAPLSTATVTSRRPVLRWALDGGVDGAHVDICGDRRCTNLVTSFDVTGSSATPSVELSAGVFFWRAYARRGTTTSVVSTPVWQFWVGARSASVDASWGTVSDVDGDGWIDAIIGSENAEIDVFAGVGRHGTTMHTTLLYPDSPIVPFSSIASAGDVNGDGYVDLIAGSRGAPDARGGQPVPGRAFLYAGSAMGLSSPPARLASIFMDPGFGARVASAGDVNGDGYADVIIESDQAVYVFLGGDAGLRPDPTIFNTSHPDFSRVTGSAGDMNGDGYGDILIGATSGIQSIGRVFVYIGSAAGLSPPIVLDRPDSEYGAFGASLGSAGDVNGDGYADFFVTALAAGGAGHTYVYQGNASGFSTTPMTLSQTGIPTIGAGDLNGDGYADIAIADPSATIENGVVYIFFGSASGVSSMPSVFEGYSSPVLGDAFGASLVRGGDVDKDGYGDLLIGSPGFNVNTGRATILFGSPSIAPPGRRMLIDQSNRLRFGRSIAGG